MFAVGECNLDVLKQLKLAKFEGTCANCLSDETGKILQRTSQSKSVAGGKHSFAMEEHWASLLSQNLSYFFMCSEQSSWWVRSCMTDNNRLVFLTQFTNQIPQFCCVVIADAQFLADYDVLKCHEYPLLQSLTCTLVLIFKHFCPVACAFHQNLLAPKRRKKKTQEKRFLLWGK